MFKCSNIFFDESSMDLYSLKLISIDFLDTYPVSYDDIVVWSISGSCKQADTRPRQKTNESPSYASCTDLMVSRSGAAEISPGWWLKCSQVLGISIRPAWPKASIQSLIVESGGGDLGQLEEGRFRMFLFYFVCSLFSFFLKRSPSKRGKILIVYVWL